MLTQSNERRRPESKWLAYRSDNMAAGYIHSHVVLLGTEMTTQSKHWYRGSWMSSFSVYTCLFIQGHCLIFLVTPVEGKLHLLRRNIDRVKYWHKLGHFIRHRWYFKAMTLLRPTDRYYWATFGNCSSVQCVVETSSKMAGMI